MKKKIVMALIILTFALTGCGNDSGSAAKGQTEPQTQGESPSDDTEDPEFQEAPSEGNASEEESKEERSLASLEQYMLDAGCLSGERVEKAAEMLGAIDGFGYDCGIEIYQYDTSSDTYASISAGEEIPLQGMEGFSVKFNAVNGEFALIFSSDSEADQTIIDTFMAY